MPLVLEKALEALFGENNLTSWNIHGGSYTTVTLRFSSQNGVSGQHGQSTPKTYRAKPPSAYRRDYNRKQNWIVNKERNNMQSQSSANDSGFARTDDADLQASDNQYSDTLANNSNLNAEKNVHSEESCELVCSKSCDPVAKDNVCGVVSSTTVYSSITQNKRNSDMDSHMTSIDDSITGLSMNQAPAVEIPQTTASEPAKSVNCEEIVNNGGHKTQSSIFTEWKPIFYEDGDDMCSYCDRDIDSGELMRECICKKRYRMCIWCAKSKDPDHTCLDSNATFKFKLK